jgi:hypothetical protein
MSNSDPQSGIQKHGYHWSWIITAVIVSLLLAWITTMTACWFTASCQEKCVTFIIFIASGAIGWCAGMVLSPDSRHEAATFSGAWKNMALAGSGYLVAKFDSLFQTVLNVDALASPNLLAFRIFGAIAVFTLAAIAVYIIRIYALNVGDAQKNMIYQGTR